MARRWTVLGEFGLQSLENVVIGAVMAALQLRLKQLQSTAACHACRKLIVSWTSRGNLSSLGAITHCTYTSIYTAHTLMNSIHFQPDKTFGDIHSAAGKLALLSTLSESSSTFLAVFLYMCWSSCYVLYIHTSLSIQALWPSCSRFCILSLFLFGLQCAYVPFSDLISPLLLSFSFAGESETINHDSFAKCAAAWQESLLW